MSHETQDPHLNEFHSLLRKFFSDHLTSSYLRERIEKKIYFDPELWEKLKALGLFEAFSDSDSGVGVNELYALAFESGFHLLPERVALALLAGPLLFRIISQTDQIKLLECLGDEAESKAVKLGQKSVLCPAPVEASAGTGAVMRVSTLATLPAPVAVIVPVINEKKDLLFALTSLKQRTLSTPLGCLDLTLGLVQTELPQGGLQYLSAEASSKLEVNLMVIYAAELTGIARKVLAMTLDYLRERKQYGVPIGGFQTVQHRVADLATRLEALEALLEYAVSYCDKGDNQAELATRSALIYARELVPSLVEQAIQLFGGIGSTWEHDLHLYLRRAQYLAGVSLAESRVVEVLGEVA